jgi:hypothetical protein
MRHRSSTTLAAFESAKMGLVIVTVISDYDDVHTKEVYHRARSFS